MNFLFGVMLDFSAALIALFGLVDGWNMFIAPVNFADGMTMEEGFGVMLLSGVFFVQSYDFAAALHRIPGNERFSSVQKGELISSARTLCFLGVLGLMHLFHWLNS